MTKLQEITVAPAATADAEEGSLSIPKKRNLRRQLL